MFGMMKSSGNKVNIKFEGKISHNSSRQNIINENFKKIQLM